MFREKDTEQDLLIVEELQKILKEKLGRKGIVLEINLERNISREAALHWIDQIRRNGLDSSFIHRRESDELLVKKLGELIESM
ncbi:MAG: hypothetical protein HFI91_08210 [Lachnospiraceae bacterium]|nr:hypothetical protein [Lachnospiraceae bacterium]